MAGKRTRSIFDTGKAAAAFAAENWMEACRESVQTKGYFAAALSGGRTPIDFYRMLSENGKGLPWSQTHIFFADERYVPATHKESNYRLVWECLLSQVPVPEHNVHRVRTEEATAERAAETYEQEIRRFFGIEGARIPEFGLIMLGIGEDGHTASLFPGASYLTEDRRVAIPVVAEKPPYMRISLSLPLLTTAQRIMFLVTGSQKAGVVREIIEDSESMLPASIVKRRARNVHVVMDAGAASLLS
jgi:6-phosphogluconolactonase